MRDAHAASATMPAPRGWSGFVTSPLGHASAFAALAATALAALQPVEGTPGSVQLSVVLLAFIALGCVAVLAYRDHA